MKWIKGGVLSATQLNKICSSLLNKGKQILTKEEQDQVRENIGIKNLVDGSNTKSIRSIDAAEENEEYTIGYGATSLGGSTKAKGAYSQAEGYASEASAYCTHAEGYRSLANGSYSHAEGNSTIASGNGTHSEGNCTRATGGYSHAEGYETHAAGWYSHSEGQFTYADNDSAHAEGKHTFAHSSSCHAEGFGGPYFLHLTGEAGATTYTNNNTKAWDIDTIPKNLPLDCLVIMEDYSSSEPIKIHDITYSSNDDFSKIATITTEKTLSDTAINDKFFCLGIANANWQSHSEGTATHALGYSSHSEGSYTWALGENQHVFGQYNVPNTTSLEIVGNGTSKESGNTVTITRSNARTLDKNGNEVLAGKLTVGTQATADNDVPTLAQVRALIQEALNQQQS